jgi:gamma-glutamyltranspeptidase/glutathione hydrolase
MIQALHLPLWFIALTVLSAPSHAAERGDRSQGRSMVVTQGGIVASEHPLASAVGANILAAGGNAIDAAVATNAMMGLVAPMMDGIGGDLFAIVYEAKTGKLYGLNASGWTPAKLTVDFMREQGAEKMPFNSIHAVTVPGAVAGWDALISRFGIRKLADALSPAIAYARAGFPITEQTAIWWDEAVPMLNNNADAVAIYLPGGRAPQAGDVFRNPDLAFSLQAIAKDGADAFYRGVVADKILATVRAQGSLMEPADLAEYKPQWVEPIATTYRGWRVYEMPPNGQGIAALEMLNLMETFPLREWGHNSAQTLHAMIELKKLAYADMLRYDADPRFSDVPVQPMLSKRYAEERARLVDSKRANCNVPAGTPPPTGTDTTYLSVVDADGNMVSLIQSNFALFGSGIAVKGGGFVLHNRGGLFSLEMGAPNVLAGRKRPLHTIIPAFMENADRKIGFGVMGGWNQSQAHAQVVSNIGDFDMNIQAAIEAARFTKLSFAGCDVRIEDRVPAAVRTELEALGHQVTLMGSFSEWMGGGQAVMRDFKRSVNYGASDPRKDGAAVPEVQAQR